MPKEKRVRRPKLTIDDIREGFRKANCELLSEEYRGCKQRLKYRCKGCGKTNMTCWNAFSRGFRCKECAIRKRLKPVPRRIILRDKLYSLAEAARWLNVRYDDLRKYVIEGFLPGPTKKLGAKMYFTEEDLKKIDSLIE